MELIQGSTDHTFIVKNLDHLGWTTRQIQEAIDVDNGFLMLATIDVKGESSSAKVAVGFLIGRVVGTTIYIRNMGVMATHLLRQGIGTFLVNSLLINGAVEVDVPQERLGVQLFFKKLGFKCVECLGDVSYRFRIQGGK